MAFEYVDDENRTILNLPVYRNIVSCEISSYSNYFLKRRQTDYTNPRGHNSAQGRKYIIIRYKNIE